MAGATYEREKSLMDMNDLMQFYALLKANAYLLLAAFSIGLFVRALKSDTKIPFEIPSRFRPPVAALLGIVAGGLEAVAKGMPFQDALRQGAIMGLVTILGHFLVIDVIRGGKEIPLPWLMKDTPPEETPTVPEAKKQTLRKPPPLPVLVLFVLVLGGCAKFFKVLDLAADKAKCVVANQDLPDHAIFVKCALEDPEAYLDLLAESRAATQKALARQASTRGDADAGAPPDGGL